ncbi:MAG: hypothetical protein QOH96_158, partial [Blastocatellia bacterium]|nr:hypothetical protein [Blastocatellia bacterium]
AAAQNKRLYYKPAKRGSGAACDVTRTKISLREDHLLQRLIYIESEPFERAKEAGQAIDDEAMIVHYVKHLARITIKRNSFYVALGLCRLLYNYSTAQAMEIYNVVVQDPERVKDDYYYRSRKSRLVDEINERFGELIQLTRGARGEERIQSGEINPEQADVVLDCLRRFVPWETKCILPTNFDPTSVEIPELSSGGSVTDEIVEINRVHSLLDPACYEQLVTSLRLDLPSEKLRIPKFFLQKGGNDLTGDGNDRRRPPRMNDADLEVLKNSLADQSSRRKRTFAGVMAIVVDGMEYAQFDPGKGSKTLLTIKNDAELVEVYARQPAGDLLLATHFLNIDDQLESSQSSTAEIVLEGGQKLTFTVSSEPGLQPAGSIRLEIGYKETAALRWFALSILKLRQNIGGIGSVANPLRLPVLGAALSIILLAMTSTGIWIAIRQRKSEVRGPEVAQNLSAPGVSNVEKGSVSALQQLAANKEAIPAAEPKSTGTNENTNRRLGFGIKGFGPGTKIPGASETHDRNIDKVPGVRNRRQVVPPNDDTGNVLELTRTAVGNRSQSAIVELSKVRKVYVEPIGDGESIQHLATMLRSDARLFSKWLIVDNKDNADAVLKLKGPSRKSGKSTAPGGALATGPDQVETSDQYFDGLVVVQLVNEDGVVLWPLRKRESAGRYKGKVNQMAGKIAGDLSLDVSRSNRVK